MENILAKRWITGIILVAIVLVIIIFGSKEALAAVITVAIIGGVCEYNNIVFGRGFIKEKSEGLFFAIIIPLVALFADSQMITAVLAFSVIVVFILFLWSVKESTFDILSVAKVMLGIVYIPFLMSHFILLRKITDGVYWILFILVLAFVGDTLALYVGKYFGKRKLIVLVSPGKTWEGTIALVSGSVVACLIYSYFLLPGISFVHIFILAFVGSIIGQLGDLCESAIKRNYGHKDASSLLPGHGGLLDRLDCLIFIAPFVYYYKIFVIG
jgi:phosphatidate cytidylyltransferase